MPVVNGLENEFAGDAMMFIRLDANSAEGGSIQAGFGLRGHPSIAILNAEGDVVEKFVGAQPAETLRTIIAQVLQSSP